MVHKDQKVIKVPKVFQVSMVPEVHPDHRALAVMTASLAPLESLAILAVKDPPDHPVTRVHVVLPVPTVKSDDQVQGRQYLTVHYHKKLD